MKHKLEVCLSPALLHLYDTNNCNVVIIDIFRATSTITAALHNGAACVIPVATVEECIAIGNQTPNSITAGERDGKVATGLAYGNSPFEYPADFINGKTLVLTTTNGTKLLHMVKGASNIIIGSFLNLDAVIDFLKKDDKPVILGCAAWKDRFNLEDTLLAGAMAASLSQMGVKVADDATRAAIRLWNQAKTDVAGFLSDANHVQRFQSMHAESDLDVCLKIDTSKKVVYYVGGELVTERP
jgi:2-phosphosulfolactate phosphatase